MEYSWNGEDWEIMDNAHMNYSQEDYEADYLTALNAEYYSPITRSMTEWHKIAEPMTVDDFLDTMVFIQELP